MKQAYRRPERWAEGEANGPGAGFEAVVPNARLKLMDPVREVTRPRHYSMRTEHSYRN